MSDLKSRGGFSAATLTHIGGGGRQAAAALAARGPGRVGHGEERVGGRRPLWKRPLCSSREAEMRTDAT